MKRTRTTRAVRDESCAWCGYPFDEGDEVLALDAYANEVFCSKPCAVNKQSSP